MEASIPDPRRRVSALRALGASLALLGVVLLGACAPTATDAADDPLLRPFDVEPIPVDDRWVIAVPNFSVRAGSVRVVDNDLRDRSDAFYRELGSGVADIFLSEAFRSGRFRITERAELDKVLLEQNLAASGRVDSATAAEVGRITGAELIVLGSLTEFAVDSSGGGGRVLGVFGGAAETVTARATVDIRVVDAVTAEVLAIGIGTAFESQSNVTLDVFNVIQGLQAGRSGTSIVDIAVRNAIRAAIDEAAASLPPKS